MWARCESLDNVLKLSTIWLMRNLSFACRSISLLSLRRLSCWKASFRWWIWWALLPATFITCFTPPSACGCRGSWNPPSATTPTCRSATTLWELTSRWKAAKREEERSTWVIFLGKFDEENRKYGVLMRLSWIIGAFVRSSSHLWLLPAKQV